ncbi:MAG: hypothetical protein ACXWAB_06855 [Methylobacter sp.]
MNLLEPKPDFTALECKRRLANNREVIYEADQSDYPVTVLAEEERCQLCETD